MSTNLDNRIPVTILTGFLGAGKTTALNEIIKSNKGKKLAVIENEFGEIPIDNELVVNVEDGIFELSNGCICCSLNDELIPILNKLLKSSHEIEHLIIETTGIANPGAVALSFLSDVQVKSLFRLDGIIALTDARFIEQQLEDHEEACRQVALADYILINKVDCVEDYQVDTLKNILKRINPLAKISVSKFGEVAGTNLLELDSFSAREVIKTRFELNFEEKNQTSHFTPSSHSINGPSIFRKNHQHSDIRSQSFLFKEALDPMKFDIWIRLTLNAPMPLIFRVKGILHFRDLDEKIVFQGVNNQFVSERGGKWGNEEKVSKIVFIGKGLNRELLEKGLNACRADGTFNPESFFKDLTPEMSD